MANKQSQGVPFRCKNRFGRSDLQTGKCDDYGSKGHPGNIVYLRPQELPPGNKLPKCPCCGVELEPIKQERSPTSWGRYAGIGIAVLLAAAVLAWWLWPSPPPPPPVTPEALLKEVWPWLR